MNATTSRDAPHISGYPLAATSVVALIRERAREMPGADAIISPGRSTVSYSQLAHEIEELGGELARRGIGRGDHVGVLVRDRQMMAITHLAIQSIATSVPLQPESPANELATAAGDFDLVALVTDRDKAESLAGTGVPTLRVERRPASDEAGQFVLDGQSIGPAKRPGEPHEDDVATLLYTSGSTARPRMVPQTQGNRAVAAVSAGIALGITSTDRCLNVMPLYHTAGLHQELAGALVRGAAVILAGFDPQSFPGLLRTFRPTWFNLTPQMYGMVLPHLQEAGFRPGELSLRFLRSGSSAMSETLQRDVERALHAPMVNVYGSSETSFIAMSSTQPGATPIGSVGRPHSGIYVSDEDGAAIGPGEIGEIRVKGPTVITSYYKNPAADAEQFVDGWFKTGDTGYLDDDGFLFLTGRLRELIDRGGEKISPFEIENVLENLPGIERAAVFGVPLPDMRQEVNAACVMAAGCRLSTAEIRLAAAGQLSWSRVPKRVFIVDRLPVTSTGKLQRNRLAEMLCGTSSKDGSPTPAG